MVPGLGTGLNTVTVLIGSAAGLAVGRVLPARVLTTIMHGLGLFTLIIGITLSVRARNPLLILASTLVGALVGEALRLDDGLQALGAWLERSLTPQRPAGGGVAAAFVTTSLLFCVGPLTFLGTFDDGTRGDITLLAIKSMLDGFASLAYAAALGWGVALSAGTVLVFQGALTAGAFALQSRLPEALTNELSAVGGLIIVALGLNLLELKRIRVVSFLPALVLLPALVVGLQQLGFAPL
jgi:uncharacterized membrane protein YqgA involved in biofilm formation